MADTEMASAVEDKPESSKAGLRRMQHLASFPASYQPSQHAAIQPETAQLIYTSPDPTRPGNITTIFSPRPPRLLPTPGVLLPPTNLAVSGDGEWVIAFHPSPPVPGLVTEGGTIAIYASSLLDLTATPARTLAHATFSIPGSPLSILPIYPLRGAGADGKLEPQRGPRVPVGYDTAKGPAFVVLTPTGALLFAPNRAGTMGMLRVPLHTRWSAVPGGEAPPEMGKRIDKGTLAIVGGEEGVWAGWMEEGEVRVTRLEVGMDRTGNHYLRATPMPNLPSLQPKDGMVVDKGIAFVLLNQGPEEGKPNGQVNGNANHSGSDRARVGAVIIQRLENQEGIIQTRLCTVAFERRENEIAQGFTDLGGEDGGGRTWDWFTSPTLSFESTSPPNTSLVALHPLPAATPATLANAVLSSPSGLVLTHLNLCPGGESGADKWNAVVGDQTPLPFAEVRNLELVIAPGAAGGGMGLVGVRVEGRITWVVSPSLRGEGSDGAAEEAAKSILRAVRQDVSYADTVRAALGTVAKAGRSATAIEILAKVHETLRAQHGLGALEELFKLQTALYSAAHDSRKTMSRELVQLCAARQILSSCAERSGNDLSFELGSLWPMLNVAEWLMITLASSFRELIALQGKFEWEEPDTSLPSSTRALFIIHPYLRFLLVDLLFYVRGFVNFCLALDQSIAPPASRDPLAAGRDPRVTIVLKDQVRDLEIKYGLEIDTWGKALTALNIKAGLTESELSKSLYTLSLEPIQPLVMPTLASLPSPSALLLSDTGEEGLWATGRYDVVAFTKLGNSKQGDARGGLVSCDRCGHKSAILRDKVLGANGLQGGLISGGVGDSEVWNEWRRAGETGCACGGTWI